SAADPAPLSSPSGSPPARGSSPARRQPAIDKPGHVPPAAPARAPNRHLPASRRATAPPAPSGPAADAPPFLHVIRSPRRTGPDPAPRRSSTPPAPDGRQAATPPGPPGPTTAATDPPSEPAPHPSSQSPSGPR